MSSPQNSYCSLSSFRIDNVADPDTEEKQATVELTFDGNFVGFKQVYTCARSSVSSLRMMCGTLKEYKAMTPGERRSSLWLGIRHGQAAPKGTGVPVDMWDLDLHRVPARCLLCAACGRRLGGRVKGSVAKMQDGALLIMNDACSDLWWSDPKHPRRYQELRVEYYWRVLHPDNPVYEARHEPKHKRRTPRARQVKRPSVQSSRCTSFCAVL